ncbi:MAG: exodeoxyribonuclease VII small subunit [Firmicutes bacterium]|nr:exodeoxyribonuclease VII small subunit [Bacillota bacterium]
MSDDLKLSFEEALTNLEGIIKQLEDGEITLEQSLKLFEQGVKLARICTAKLDDYEDKIEILLEKDGEFLREPFSCEGE